MSGILSKQGICIAHIIKFGGSPPFPVVNFVGHLPTVSLAILPSRCKASTLCSNLTPIPSIGGGFATSGSGLNLTYIFPKGRGIPIWQSTLILVWLSVFSFLSFYNVQLVAGLYLFSGMINCFC